ncbi:hypothetical protein D3C79_870700 [compost metagenome]
MLWSKVGSNGAYRSLATRPWPFSARRTSSSRSASRRNASRTRGSLKGALAVFMSNDSQLPLTDFSSRSRGSACSTCRCSVDMTLAMSICPARNAARRPVWSLKSMISSSSA